MMQLKINPRSASPLACILDFAGTINNPRAIPHFAKRGMLCAPAMNSVSKRRYMFNKITHSQLDSLFL